MMPLKLSCNEQRAVIVFICEQKDLMQVKYTLRCIQFIATSVLQSQQYTCCVRKF